MMKKGYWVVAYRSISDPEALKAYGALAGPAIQAHGGQLLVRADIAVPYESGLQSRTVVVEFESLAKAEETHASDAYNEALKALGSSADRDFRIVEGV